MSSVPPPVTDVQESPSTSGFSRIIGTYFSPGSTFVDIARRPSWVLPIVILTLFSLAFAYFLNQRMDWRAYMRTQIEQSDRTANMSPEQKNQIIEQQSKWSPYVAWVFGSLGNILACLIMSLIFWAAYNLLGGAGARYGQAFGISAHAQLVNLIGGIIGLIIMFGKDPTEIDPNNLVASNLGALIGSDGSKILKALLSQFDAFVIWYLILIAIGFRAINPKKLAGKTYTIAFGLLGLWALLRVGWAAIFG